MPGYVTAVVTSDFQIVSLHMGLVARKPVFGVSEKRVSNQSP